MHVLVMSMELPGFRLKPRLGPVKKFGVCFDIWGLLCFMGLTLDSTNARVLCSYNPLTPHRLISNTVKDIMT